MQNKEFENIDQLFRNAIESLPEEKPGAGEWSAMKQRIAGEGLLKDRTRIRPLFLLFMLVTLTGISAFYLLDSADSKEQDQQISGQVPAVISIPEDRRHADSSTPVQNREGSAAAVSRQAEKLLTPVKAITQPINTTSEMTAPAKVRSERKSLAYGLRDNPAPLKEKAGLPQKQNNPSAPIPSAEKTIADERDKEVQSVINPAVVTGEEPLTVATVSEALPEKIPSPVMLQQLNSVNDMPDSLKVMQQVDRTIPQNRQRFTIGLYISKDVNTYLLKTKTADGAIVESSTAIRGQESFWQYTTGITAGYAVQKRITLQTGIFFSQKKKVTATNSYVGFKEDTALNRNYANYQYNLNADYLEFTLKLKYYYAGTGSWRFYAAPGLCAGMNFPVRSDRSYFLREEHNKGITQSDRIMLEPFSMGLDVTGALGVERRVKRNWIIYAEPAYRYGLDPVIRHRNYSKIPVEHYLRAFGMGFGAMYSF